MEVEHDIKVIKVPFAGNDSSFKEEIEKLTKEGWMLVPGVQPVAIYHVVRQKPATLQANSGRGTMLLDDTKIGIIRNGQIVG